MADTGLTTLPYTMTPQQMAQFQQQLSSGNFSTQPPQTDFGNLISSLAPVLTGAMDLGTAHLSMSDAQRAAGMADPWSSNRGQYQTQLNSYMGANSVNPSQVTAGTNNALSMLGNLLSNPGSLTNMPGYQFGLNQALEGVNRGAGASGLLNSGNRLAALQDRGEGYAMSAQQQMFNELLGNVGANVQGANLGLNAQNQGYGQLANLAGVNAGSPTAAAQALLNGRQQQQNQLSGGIGGLASGAGAFISAMQRLLGSGGGGGLGTVGSGFNNASVMNPDSNIPNLPGTGTFNPDDLSGWMNTGGWTDTLGDASGGLGGGLDWIDTLGGFG